MSERDSHLPPRVEALLSGFALPERDFEAMEAKVRAQIEQTAIGSTAAALLEAPLPAEPGEDEGTAAASPPATLLSDLARSVAHKKVDAADAEIARETLSVASKLRSQTDVLIERMRAAPRSAEPPLRPRPAPPSESSGEAPAVSAAPPVKLPPPPYAPRSDPPAALGAGSATSQKNRRTAWWAGAGLSLAAAATLVLMQKMPDESASESAPVAAVQASDAARPPGAPTPSPVTPTGDDKGGTSPEPEPERTTAAAEAKREAEGDAAIAQAPEESSVARARVASGAAPAKAGPRGGRAEKVVLDETPAAKPAGKAPASAAQAQAESALKPAAGKSDGLLPDKPSTGAVQAAIASVMYAARRCVAGDTDPTPATVIFSASGTVKSVVVNGAAQGSPAGKCIQYALGRAKVAPFAQNTFSVGVSVRP